ncbi:hypothetical protein EsH8_VII_000086 [Colletotrichum jinshuiense]
MALAAPVSRDGFSFAGDSFSVSASGHVHRRCSIPELKAHFEALGNGKDHPGHWYEAQLLHYGLPPSKVKGTAKMRLLEAVNSGRMAVPAPIAALERELKKEYTAANKKAAIDATKRFAPAKAAGTKRKTEGVQVITNVSLSKVHVSVTLNNGAETPSTKKVKTVANTGMSEHEQATTKAAKKPANKTVSSAYSELKANKDDISKTAPREAYALPTRDVSSTSQGSAPSPAGRKQSAPHNIVPFGGPVKYEPGIKDEFGDDSPYDYPFSGHHDGDYFEAPLQPQPVRPLSISFSHFYDEIPVPAPLGLINGRYEIYETDNRDVSSGGDCWLVCTIDGDQLWVSFDLGFLNGVMMTGSRPRRSSLDPLPFNWCGQSRTCYEGYNASNQSFLAFVGDGFIDGTIDWNGQDLTFKARRLDGQSTRSEISARAMREEWNILCDG